MPHDPSSGHEGTHRHLPKFARFIVLTRAAVFTTKVATNRPCRYRCQYTHLIDTFIIRVTGFALATNTLQTTTVGNVTLTYGTRANAIRIGRTGTPSQSSPSLQESQTLTTNHTAHGASGSTSIGAGRIVNTDIISSFNRAHATSTSIAATILTLQSVINTGSSQMPSSTQTPESQAKLSIATSAIIRTTRNTAHTHHIGHHRIRRYTHYYRYIDYWRRKLGHQSSHRCYRNHR